MNISANICNWREVILITNPAEEGQRWANENKHLISRDLAFNRVNSLSTVVHKRNNIDSYWMNT